MVLYEGHWNWHSGGGLFCYDGVTLDGEVRGSAGSQVPRAVPPAHGASSWGWVPFSFPPLPVPGLSWQWSDHPRSFGGSRLQFPTLSWRSVHFQTFGERGGVRTQLLLEGRGLGRSPPRVRGAFLTFQVGVKGMQDITSPWYTETGHIQGYRTLVPCWACLCWWLSASF